jgi:hypothetical protein
LQQVDAAMIVGVRSDRARRSAACTGGDGDAGSAT